jgi:hypothetical protein
MLKNRKNRGRVALLLGALAPLLLLTPLSMTGAGAASSSLVPTSQAISNAVTQACATGVYTEPSDPSVPATLVGKSVQVSGCSQFAPASTAENGTVSPMSGVGAGYCTASSGGSDDGTGTSELGYTLQNCTAYMDLMEAWNTDYFKFDGVNGWYTMCNDVNTRWEEPDNDSFCDDGGEFSGTYWKVMGRSEIILPAGYVWTSVQPGCTGVNTATELCTSSARGFLAYWNA